MWLSLSLPIALKDNIKTKITISLETSLSQLYKAKEQSQMNQRGFFLPKKKKKDIKYLFKVLIPYWKNLFFYLLYIQVCIIKKFRTIWEVLLLT